MFQAVWNLLASPGAALMASILAVTALIFLGAHRDLNRQISRQKIVACMLLTIASYTFMIVIVGYFYLGEPDSSVIESRIGDNRFVWLLVAMSADSFARLFRMFNLD